MRRLFQRGNATIEMTLVGIPMVFILISTFEMSRGMWIYHTLSFAARETSRYISIHGPNCQTDPNTCGLQQIDLYTFINNAATGLVPADLNIDFTSPGQSFSCKLSALNTGSCGSIGGAFIPPAGSSGVGTPIALTLKYPFRSAISMFWPGAGPGFVFGAVTLPATSQDVIQY